jgi:hypothetical protein
VDRVSDDLALAPEEALAEALRLVDAGLAFQAHEVLEGIWKATSGIQRPLWQGLAQLAVGLTHAQRGNATGAAALLERGADRVAVFGQDPPYGLDVVGLCSAAKGLAARIRARGLAGLTVEDLRLPLRSER